MAMCYILYSKSTSKFYTGVTTNTVEARLAQHNQASYGMTRFTAVTSDWEVYVVIAANNYAHAVRIERKIKSMKSSEYIRNLFRYPELRAKLTMSTSNS